MAGNFFDGPDDAAAPAPEQAAPQQDYAPPGAAQGASDQQIVDNENAARRKINEKNQPKNFFGDEDDTVKPEAPKEGPKAPREDFGVYKGFVGEVGHFLTFLHRSAVSAATAMAGAGDPEQQQMENVGIDTTPNVDEATLDAKQQEWTQKYVHPMVQATAQYDLPPDATAFEKLRYGAGGMAATIGEAYMTGGASLAESIGGKVAGKLGASTALRRWAAMSAGGAAFMQPAAIEHATAVGDQVLEATGDKKAAAVAASTAWVSTSLMGAIPFGARGGLTGVKGAAVGAASAFVAGAGSEEAQRVAENASKPDALQENFSVENMLIAGAVATPLGLLPHGPPHVEAAENVNEMAQRHAAEIVREGGGDNLDAVGAATQVAAEVGGVHDAAAVHAAREEEAQQQQGAMEMRRAQAQAAAEADQADIDRGQQEQAAAEQKKAEEDAAYAEKAHQDQAAKDADFQAAKNQTADEEVESANAAETGTEKGGGNEPKPTLADALPPEQRSVLEQLKAQRAAEAAKPPEPAKETDTTPEEGRSPAADTRAAQAEAEQQNETGAAKVEAATAKPGGLPPEAEPQTLQERRLAAAAAEQETPPPVPQTLKERRAAEKAAAKAAKETAAAKADSDFVPLEEPAKPAAEAPEEAQEPTEAEEPETPKPPAPTPETLAERRQQALDEARAAAEGGARPPFPGEEEAGTVAPEATPAAAEPEPPEASGSTPPEASEPATAGAAPPLAELSTTLPEGSDRMKQAGRGLMRKVLEARKRNQEGVAAQAEPVKNRLAAIRAAAEKARAAKAAPAEAAKPTLSARRAKQVSPEPEPLPERGPEKQFVARNADTGEEVARFNTFEEARDHKEKFPNDDITHEAPPDMKASAAENDWFNESQRHVAEDMDRALKPRMSHDEAREHLAPVLDHFGPRQFHVDPSAAKNTVGDPVLKQQIKDWLAEHPNGKLYGVYDNKTGIAHVFADAHNAGDRQSLLETAIHELTHKGLPALLKEKYGPVMDAIYASVKDTAWARELVARRKMDLRSIDNQRLVADEYAAHMSENILTGREVHEGLPVLDRNPTIKQRFFDAVRSVMRALGIDRHWNDHDIARLVRQAHMGLGDPTNKVAREGAAYKGPRFSADENDARIDDLYAPDHPDAIGHKIGRTAEEQGKYNPGFVKDTERLLKDVAHGKPDALLGAIGLRNIPDFIRQESMPSAHAFIDDHDSMEGRRRMILKPTIERAHDWSKFQASQPDRGEALTDLMHAFTLNGLSADKPYEERHTAAERAADPAKMTEEKTRREVNKFLQQKFNEQPPEARAIYKQVRDDYTDMRIKTLKGIEDRINATGADEQTKKNAMAELRKSFESGQVKGDYFPLQRFGDLWASASDKEGNHVAFSRHESQTGRKEWLKAMRDQGFDVDQGERMDDKSEMERISPDFVKNVMAHVEAADPTGSLAKDVWQEYLKAMPEMSMRKHMITRVGRLGYSRDALRAYAFNMFHGAHQLARLEYGHKLDARLAGIKEEAQALQTRAAKNPDDKLAQTEGKWAPAIAREMSQRYDWLRNPRASKLASNITKFGFSWYLGAAPATAFRIFSQNPMLAAPQLAKHFGWLGASKELGSQSMKWASKLGMRGYGDSFRGDERRAYDEADQRGVFSDTNTQMMASGGDGSPMFQGGWYQFQKYAGYMFNAMEHHNRATTLMAGYRLGRTQGMDHDSASRLARQITWDSHFDYTNANRPRYLQGDIPKVVGLFKQYSLGVTYRLAREGADMINRTEKTPQQRLAAAGALASLIGRMTLFAGATGVPGYWIAEKLVNWWMGDDDKPYDMTAALHKHLNDTMGTTMGDAIMTGPVGAISGASLSTGASYNDLWYKPNLRTEEPQQQVYDAMGQLLGPIGALPLNATLGGQQMAQGNIERGLEHFLPPEASALAKAVRYFREGALNTKGQNILPQGQSIDSRDVFLQSLGFTPQKVADAQRRNTVVRNLEKAITDQRELLSGRYESAILVGDQKTAAATWTKIQAFNKANPEAAIGPGLASGTIGLARRNANSVQGIPQTPTTRKLEEKY